MNPYSTIKIFGAGSLPERMQDARSIRLKSLILGNSNSETYQQSLQDYVETVETDINSLQLMTERDSERHLSLFGSDIASQREALHESTQQPHQESIHHSQEQLQIHQGQAPFTMQNIFLWFPLQFSHQERYPRARVPSERDFLQSMDSNSPETRSSSAEVLDNIQMQNNYDHRPEHDNAEPYSGDGSDMIFPTISFPSEHDGNEAEAHENDHMVLECPLLEHMKFKRVNVSLNASFDNFELKISGHENFFRFLQNLNFPIHSYNPNKRYASQSVSESTEHETETHGTRLNNQQNHLIVGGDNASSDYNDTNTHQNYASTTALMHSATSKEVIQEKTLMNETSEVVGLSANNTNNTEISANDTKRLPVLIVENPSPSLSSGTFAFHDYYLDKGNFSENNISSIDSVSAEEANTPNSPESNNFINSSRNTINPNFQVAQSDVIHTDTSTPVYSDNITMNANETGNSDMNGHRLRRNIKITPITQRHRFCLLDFFQGKFRTRNTSQMHNKLSQNEDYSERKG